MSLFNKSSLLVAAAMLLFSCQDHDTPAVDNPTAPGLAYSKSDQDFNATYSSLQTALKANPDISIVAEVNHTANAQSVNLELRPTRVILFGNPAIGTPLMQANQLAGLDLPQKMLVYQAANNDVFVAYNNSAYLSARHSGVGAAATIEKLGMALSGLAKGASMGTITETSNPITLSGIVTVESKNDFATTYNILRTAISGNEKLKIVAELDHQANARKVGMTLNPTKLIVFGNPALGSPLIQSAQTIAVDLPQKMLVWETAGGKVNVSYNDPGFLANRHGVKGNVDTIDKIKDALAGLTAVATAK